MAAKQRFWCFQHGITPFEMVWVSLQRLKDTKKGDLCGEVSFVRGGRGIKNYEEKTENFNS